MNRNLIRLLLIVCALTVGIAVAAPPPRFAYVANTGSSTVSVIDLATDTVVATITVGQGPVSVAIRPDGKQVWVAGTDNSTIRIDEIDTATNLPVATISLPCPNFPCTFWENSLAFTPDGTTAYLVNNFPASLGSTVFVVNVEFNIIGRAIQVGHLPAGVAFTPDSQLAYVDDSEDFSVSVIDVPSSKVVATIGPNNIGNAPFGIAVLPKSKRVYVPYCAPGAVAVIEANNIIATVDGPNGSCPFNIAFPEHGKFGYVTNLGIPGGLFVIDTHTNTVVATIDLGPACSDAHGVAAAGRRVLVTCASTSTVVVVDTVNNKVVDAIPVGLGPRGIAIRPLP
jgi:YVTN family beta-propeller protein